MQALGVPLPALVLALQCHMALRRIRFQSKVGPSLSPAIGILAGCSSSTSLARVELRDTLADQTVDTHQHVDDVAMLASELDPIRLERNIMTAAAT